MPRPKGSKNLPEGLIPKNKKLSALIKEAPAEDSVYEDILIDVPAAMTTDFTEIEKKMTAMLAADKKQREEEGAKKLEEATKKKEITAQAKKEELAKKKEEREATRLARKAEREKSNAEKEAELIKRIEKILEEKTQTVKKEVAAHYSSRINTLRTGNLAF